MAIMRVTSVFILLILGAIMAPQAAGLTIFSTTGTEPDPLTSPFPLAVRAGETKSVGVLLATTQSRGYVSPTVTCCTDVATGAQVSPTGVDIRFVLPASIRPYPRGFLVSSTQEAIAQLTVTAAAGTPPGQYSAKIAVSHPLMGASEQTIFVNVLGPTPADDTTTPCPSQVNNVVVGNGTPPSAEVLPLMGTVDSVFAVKATSPGKTSFGVGARTTDNRNAWDIRIARQDPVPQVSLKPNEAIIVFANDTNSDKDLWTVNGAACNSTTQHIHAAKGQSGSITIRATDSTTLLLRRDVCSFRFIGCWASYSEPVAIFTQPPFWSFVGGRVVTIRWFQSTGD
jgi:hypothetical protein